MKGQVSQKYKENKATFGNHPIAIKAKRKPYLFL